MARRNHSRRVHAPYGEYPGIGYAEDVGGRSEAGRGRRGEEGTDEGRWAMDEMGGASRMIADRPYTSLMTAFGVGFGLGLFVTLLLTREEEGWFERYAPDAIQDLPDRLRHAGNRMSDSVSGSLRHAGHMISDSMSGPLKHAGEAVASYVPSSWRRW
jgi:hypothetical protein